MKDALNLAIVVACWGTNPLLAGYCLPFISPKHSQRIVDAPPLVLLNARNADITDAVIVLGLGK